MLGLPYDKAGMQSFYSRLLFIPQMGVDKYNGEKNLANVQGNLVL